MAEMGSLEHAPPLHRRRFSSFDPEQSLEAAGLAVAMSLTAWQNPDDHNGLSSSLDLAEIAAATRNPELVEHALALFVTHDRQGRKLDKPRSPILSKSRFAPSDAAFRSQPEPPPLEMGSLPTPAPPASAPSEPDLDFWREDILANEHHLHWHEVYPAAGIPPEDWTAWTAQAELVVLVEIFRALDPSQDWAAILPATPRESIAEALKNVVRNLINLNRLSLFLRNLSAPAFRALMHLNHRHGELFLYMHEQMLARYDAERLSVGLPRVTPLDDLGLAIPDAYSPPPWLQAEGFRERQPNRTLGSAEAGELTAWSQAIFAAIAPASGGGKFSPPSGGSVPIDRENLGEVVEAVARPYLEEIADGRYGNWHNMGHNHISSLSELNEENDAVGVMASTATAIRDSVFWRWHKAIDNAGFAWQETRPPYDWAAEKLAITLRSSLDSEESGAWRSPDLIFCRTADLPGSTAADFFSVGGPELGRKAFGGEAWSSDFSDAEVELEDGSVFRTTGILETERRTAEMEVPQIGDQGPWTTTVDYLAHQGFCYFLRVENPSAQELPVTVRIFAAPEESAEDRRSWIEMDKFSTVLPANQRTVLFRADEESSVVKKPIDRGLEPSASAGEAYCDCGWPYRLLLPSGTQEGKPFLWVVFLSDGTKDQISKQGKCGSMSYCGARDRYPDERDMGFPFSRPFPTSIESDLLGLPNVAGRRMLIRNEVVP